jgi:hypothetical protein
MDQKLTVYLETTIPSFLTGRPSNDLILAGKQEVTRRWWETRLSFYQAVVSQFVIDEAGAGDPSAAEKRLNALDDIPLLEIDDEVLDLTDRILSTGVIPAKAATDAAHIAIAARHRVDFLMTWNCTHIANAEIAGKLRTILEVAGYTSPVICTPDELFGPDENEN